MTNKLFTLTRNINKYWGVLYWYFRIQASGLFDRDWYLKKNQDVAQAKVNPLAHFILYGGFEGRDPNPNFSSRWYLNTFDDAKNSGINPLAYHLKYGRKKGFETQASEQASFLSAIDNRSFEKAKQVVELHPTRPNGQKIFCVGHNKTGTTSLEQALRELGYTLGSQREAELLMDDWAMRDFRRIIEFCKTADAFQDLPFSLNYTYQILDHEYPNAKFILTVRNNVDEWYQSLIRFHAKLMGVNGVPTIDDVKSFSYVEKGWSWIQQQRIYGVTESTLYDENIYKSYYMNHNAQILEYFRYRPKNLLVLNLANPTAMQSLCEFLEIEYIGQKMPHLNKSKEKISLP